MGETYSKVACPAKGCRLKLAALAERGPDDGKWRAYRTPDQHRIMRCVDHGAFIVSDDDVVSRIAYGAILS